MQLLAGKQIKSIFCRRQGIANIVLKKRSINKLGKVDIEYKMIEVKQGKRVTLQFTVVLRILSNMRTSHGSV